MSVIGVKDMHIIGKIYDNNKNPVCYFVLFEEPMIYDQEFTLMGYFFTDRYAFFHEVSLLNKKYQFDENRKEFCYQEFKPTDVDLKTLEVKEKETGSDIVEATLSFKMLPPSECFIELETVHSKRKYNDDALTFMKLFEMDFIEIRKSMIRAFEPKKVIIDKPEKSFDKKWSLKNELKKLGRDDASLGLDILKMGVGIGKIVVNSVTTAASSYPSDSEQTIFNENEKNFKARDMDYGRNKVIYDGDDGHSYVKEGSIYKRID